LYESEAKALLKKHQVPIPPGGVAKTAAEAEKIAGELGGAVVVKALVLFGARDRVEAANAADAKTAAEKLLAADQNGKKPFGVLIEKRTAAKARYSLRITYDGSVKLPVMLASTVTGKDIDDVAEEQPGAVKRRYFSALLPPSSYRAKELVTELGVPGAVLPRVTGVVDRLNQVLLDYDLNIVDVPSLAVTEDGKVVVEDVFMDMEIEARARQKPNLDALGVDPADARVPREPTAFDKAGAKIDKDDPRGVAGPIVEFDGNIGCVIGAGGGSLTTFDAIRRHGGRPANYAAIGGNPSVKKCQELTKLVLSKPGVEKIVVISNVVSNTRADLLARGVIKGVIELGKKPSDVIAIFRSPGAWESDAAKILKKYGVEYCDRSVSISEAARRGVEKIGK
jgi:succinyl-CoA synthetase beta subunit/citryl-CoA synthetase large subunit